MSDNMCSDHELNEERFKRIEQLLDRLSETVDTKNAALSEDIKKLTEDFNSLKEDYSLENSQVIYFGKKELNIFGQPLLNITKIFYLSNSSSFSLSSFFTCFSASIKVLFSLSKSLIKLFSAPISNFSQIIL